MSGVEQNDYEYRGLMARSWDLLRGDTSKWQDRTLYLQQIRESGEPALDVGCGTGRLLLDFLGEGIDIDGVDNSPEMLALCREKAEALGLRPTLFEQQMESLDLPSRMALEEIRFQSSGTGGCPCRLARGTGGLGAGANAEDCRDARTVPAGLVELRQRMLS